jgi:hypothetical protein
MQPRMLSGHYQGQLLKFLVEMIQPKTILEIGTYMGDSTNHILLAAENNKKEGYDCEVTTIDITDYVGNKKLHDYPLNKKIISSLELLSSKNVDFDFILQDGDHSEEIVKSEIKLFEINESIELIWSHDYYLDNKKIGNIFESNDFNIFTNRQVFKEESYISGFQIGIIN